MREDLALLERKIEKETQPSAPVAAETEAKLTALEQRLAALEAKGETAAPGEASGSGESEAVAAALAERDARIAALEKEVAAVRDQVAGLREEIALLAARARLARALDEGRPLGTALALPPPLARFATTPPPTRQSLLKALDEAERAARSAPRPGEETAVPETGIAAELREAAAEAGRLFAAALTIRHGPTVVWGDPVAAATDAARDALRRDDLSAAIDAIAGIGGPAASFFTAWLDQARALHAAREALLSFGEGA
jgi:polyhydroxyalkanoate synthesis regulator phasin